MLGVLGRVFHLPGGLGHAREPRSGGVARRRQSGQSGAMSGEGANNRGEASDARAVRSRGPRRLRASLDRPSVWGVLYLAAIPLFALAYTAVDGGFNQSTAATDAATARDSTRVGRLIAEEIGHYLRSQPQRTVRLADGTIVRTDAISTIVEHIGAVDALFSFEAELGEGKPRQITFAIFSGEAFGVENAEEIALVLRPDLERRPPARSVALSDLLPPTLVLSTATDLLEDGEALAPIRRDTLHRLRRHQSGVRGDPLAISGTFDRMLYFSVVTITTLGFGDIVPVTANARRLVALEAVVGVVLVGLFLNAIGRRVISATK